MSGPRDSRRDRPTAGFTLLEMMLVLAILATVAVATFPAVDRMYRTHRLRQTANDLRAKLAATRLRAIDEGIAYQFRYEPGGRHLVVVPQQSESLRFGAASDSERYAAGEPATWSFAASLPDGVTFAAEDDTRETLRRESLAEIEEAAELAGLSWSAAIVFTPNGRATPAEFSLREDDGRVIRMTVRSLTGAASSSEIRSEPEPAGAEP